MPPTCRPLVPRKAVDTASLKNWTWDIGCEILLWVDQQLAARTHPNQAYRTCPILLNLYREAPVSSIDAACKSANRQGLVD